MGFKSIDNWTKKHDVGKTEESMSNVETNGGQRSSLSDEKQATNVASKPYEPQERALKQNQPDCVEKIDKITAKSEVSLAGTAELTVLEKVEVSTASSPRKNEPGSPTKRATELIAFFDSGPKDKTGKSKTNKKAEKVQTKSKADDKKVSKNKDMNSKTTQNKLKAEEKTQKSQNRKSFPFNLTKLTKTKGSDRKRSAPKTNLSKAKSCGDLLTEQTKDIEESPVEEEEPRQISQTVEEQKEDLEVLDKRKSLKPTNTELSELSAELFAALATPAPQLIQINLSRDYLMANGDVGSYGRHVTDSGKVFPSEVTTNECQEVVVNLVRAFERALDCHSKILNGDIKDNQRQGLSMLAATFTTIHESITECKNERERKQVRSPRASRILEPNEEHTGIERGSQTEVQKPETKDGFQQTEYILTSRENEQIAPLLDKYSELLLKKFEAKISNN